MYKNNKFTLILPTVVAVSIAVGFKNTPPVPRRGNLVAPGSGKLNMLLSLIENRYVDTVSMDSITEKTIPFILEELDPHSVYVPAKDMAQMNESLDGEFVQRHRRFLQYADRHDPGYQRYSGWPV